MRISRTGEYILERSRRRAPAVEELRLRPWLEHFKQQFSEVPDTQRCDLRLSCDEDLLIAVVPNQLQQIRHNLCANGMRYAIQKAEQNQREPQLQLNAYRMGERLELDVIDNGGGVADEQRHLLFEPFYTTEHNGTGLGLYLCRELFETNHATIQYLPLADGSCFRLSLQATKPSYL